MLRPQKIQSPGSALLAVIACLVQKSDALIRKGLIVGLFLSCRWKCASANSFSIVKDEVRQRGSRHRRSWPSPDYIRYMMWKRAGNNNLSCHILD